MHYKKTWNAGASIGVHESHSPRMGRVNAKDSKKNVSRPAVKAYNDKIAKRELAYKINKYFLPGDGFIFLGYYRKNRPTVDEAVKNWRKFAEAMRAMCAAGGVRFSFIHAIGVGSKGGVHHHLIINRECIPFVSLCWPHGAVVVKHLYDKRNYQKLAGYFCGQEKGENPDDKKEIKIYKKYSTSRNIKKVEADVKAMDGEAWQKYPKPAKGFVIDIDSIDIGENPVNGKPYQFYFMLPLAPPPFLRESEIAEWRERELVKNKAEIRWKIDQLTIAMEEKRRQRMASVIE